MSSEIIDDIRVSTIEIASESGLNLSNFDARLKHTGAGTFTLTSTSELDNAISIDLPNGGLDVNVEKTIDFKALDSTESAITLQGLTGGIEINAYRNIQIISTNENINLNTQVGDINLESTNSINIASGLSDCNAINIVAPYGGMNTFAQNILHSCGQEPFYPFNPAKTDISPQLTNIMTKISPNKNLVGLQQDKLNANALLCPVGVYSQAADYVMAIITDRSSRPIDNDTPGVILASINSATIINAVGASGTPDDESYINSDLILYSEGQLILDSAGYSGILINTQNSTPIAMGTTESQVTVNGDLTVEGNLIVNGESVQNNVTVFTSEDPVFYLNNGITNINNTSDIGFIGKRGNYENVGWIWKESQDEWVAIGTDSNGVDNIDNDINDYKPARFGGLNVVTDTSRGPTATVFNVDLNGQITMETSLSTTDAITITSGGGIDINTVLGNDITNTGNVMALSVNQQGTADIAVFKDNGITALIVKDGGNVGVNKTNPDYPLDVNGTANATSIYQAGFLLVPTGAMMPYAASTAPGGWLICDGSAVSRTTYSALFDLIGSTYGNGDGVNTFNLPNLKGRTIFGFNSSDSNFNTLGETGGSGITSLSTNELPSHTHTGTTSTTGSHNHPSSSTNSTGNHTHGFIMNKDDGNSSHNNGQHPAGDAAIDSNAYTIQTELAGEHSHTLSISSDGSHTHTFTTNSSGSGDSFSILNPYIALNYIIKY